MSSHAAILVLIALRCAARLMDAAIADRTHRPAVMPVLTRFALDNLIHGFVLPCAVHACL